MKCIIRTAVTAVFLTAATTACEAAPGADAAMPAESIKMFPLPVSGQQRVAIALPALDDEAGARVELMIGKTMQTDCNAHWFGGELAAGTVQCWGYPYYRLSDVKGPVATMMACPEQSPRDRFVQVRGDDSLLRYNSRLPLVVYVPDGFEVRYRVWHASRDVHRAHAQ